MPRAAGFLLNYFTLLLAAAFATGAPVPGFVHWSAAELKGWNAKLAAKMQDAKPLGTDLARFGNHWSSITRRTADGQAEVHQSVNDIFICEAGEATLLYGGTVKNPKSAGPGETLGDAVAGGQSVIMRPGDMVHIPANLPHQLLVKKEFLYFVTKVRDAGPADPQGFAYWSHSDLQAYGPQLKSQLAGKNVATQQLANWKTHSFMLVFRTADGEAEIHEKQVDYFWILSGAPQVAVGGRAIHPRATAPNEIRGSGIEGGEKTAMGPGDVAHIPANVPHQALTKKDLLYAVLKVNQ
jgi:mannose-6-phosphate isomerase-like protein (cupin superfamily)